MNIDSYMHRVGDEDVFGKKVFHSDVSIKSSFLSGFNVSNDAYKLGEIITQSIVLGRFALMDKNDQWCGVLQQSVDPNNNSSLSLIVRNFVCDEEILGFLTLGICEDGTPFAACPHPGGADDYSCRIATTKWVSDLIDQRINCVVDKLKDEILKQLVRE